MDNADWKFGTGFAASIAGLASSIAQSEAIKAQGDYRQAVGNINARFSEMQARDILKQGSQESARQGKRIGQLVGSQRAALAAQGIVVGDGTAGDIEDQTREIGREEQETIKNNAWKQAFGFKQQALNQRNDGAMAKQAANFEAKNTLIAGGLNFAGGVIDSYAKNYPKSEKRSVKVDIFDPTDYSSPGEKK